MGCMPRVKLARGARMIRMIDYPYMLRRTAASSSVWRATLASALCVLALVFFIEAKTAWYGPARGVGSAVRASKAMPADVPRVIQHGVPVPDPIHPQLPFALLPALALLWTAADLPLRHDAIHSRIQSSLATFSPQLFFRPPPELS